MHINPYVFLLPKPPKLIVWNYKSHEQFEIDSAHANRLFEIIECPSLIDKTNQLDQDLFNTAILLDTPSESETWRWDDLSKIFHIGTKDLAPSDLPQTTQEWAQHYIAQCQETMSRPRPPGHRLANLGFENMLPLPCPWSNDVFDTNASLKQSLINRKTCRTFEKSSIELPVVSDLLYLALGYLSERESDANELVPSMFRARRSSPSGGGLNCSEGYLYANNVRGLDPGFYYYHPQKHALKMLSRTQEPLGALLQGQHFANDLPFGVFITSRLDKMWWKYPHSQAYRVSLLDVGHISQTLQLGATSLGLKTWLTAALSEQKIEKALALHDLSEQVFLFFGAGVSNGEENCQALIDLLECQSSSGGT